MNQHILSTAYAPPVHYFASLMQAETVLIEMHENYQKQSFRNRCNILSSTGMQALSIPVIHDKHQVITDIQINYREAWQRQHWRSIQTCYTSSPFYLFYADQFEALYNRQETFLLDWNLALLDVFSKAFSIQKPIGQTEKWLSNYPSDTVDLRNKIHPKKEALAVIPNYQTVFDAFEVDLPYLSAFDLLFNLGPAAHDYLSKLKF